MSILITEYGDKGCGMIIEAVIQNTIAIIQKPSIISKDLHYAFSREKERRWLSDIIIWTDRKDNFILNSFEAIYGYDRKKIADLIATQAWQKLLEYGDVNDEI